MNHDCETIREICAALVFYANRLDHLRGRDGTEQANVPDTTYLATDDRDTAISPWYRVIEPIYAELDTYLRGTNEIKCDEVFADPWILANEAKLHRIRACYELDKEFDQARAILRDEDPTRALSDTVSNQAFWTLAPAVCEMLAEARRIAIAGSGPLPLTALAVASKIGARVSSIERDEAACRLGRRLIEISRHANLVETVEVDIGEIEAVDGYDAVVATVLLGVGVNDTLTTPKREIVKHILSCAKPGVQLALREPYGLGRLYYPAANLLALPGLDVQRFDPDIGPDLPYRSSFLLIRRTKVDEDHARSSAATICS